MIRFAEKKDEENIRRLREISFPKDTAFFDWYIKKMSAKQNILVFEKDGEVASMLDRLPFEMNNLGKVTYIFGACTHPDYRKKGLMSELISYSEKLDKEHGIAASVLIPQNSELFHFYENLGYKPLINRYQKKYTLGNAKDNYYNFRKSSPGDIEGLDFIYRQNVKDTNYIRRTASYWNSLFSLFNELGGDIFMLELDKNPVGYAFVWNEDELIAQELCCLNNDAKKILCHNIMGLYGKNEITAYFPEENCGFEKHGCIKLYDDFDNGEPFVMNLMLD